MERSHAGPPRSRHSSDVGSGILAASKPSAYRRSKRSVSYGLGLLLVALCVGLAAALLLTIGSAHAVVFLGGGNAAF